MRSRLWQRVLEFVMLAFVLVAIVLMVSWMSGCLGSAVDRFAGIAGGRGGSMVHVADDGGGDPNVYDKVASALRSEKVNLGREAGRELMSWCARGVIGFAALTALGSVALLFLGGFVGVGRTQAVFGLGVAFAGVVVGYFITVYGVFFSEVVCWAAMAVMFVLCPVAVFLIVKAKIDERKGRMLTAKRVGSGESAKDGLQRLPVTVATKSKLDDAIETVRDAAASAMDRIEATRLLERFRLPVPGGPV